MVCPVVDFRTFPVYRLVLSPTPLRILNPHPWVVQQERFLPNDAQYEASVVCVLGRFPPNKVGKGHFSMPVLTHAQVLYVQSNHFDLEMDQFGEDIPYNNMNRVADLYTNGS